MAERAVQYVRMSTEHQRYSTENQIDAIADYALKRQIEIVRTYSDEGKSGLRLEGRPGLKRLLEEVQSETADFSMILVYDVSRRGRFQDADESAYYEHLCHRAGVSIQYCAEQFENDGSPASTIFKSVKRTMAGEYSRELSVKVFAGQCRLIELGFRQGGPAGFGLRRCLVDHQSNIKGLLGRGEHKSIQTDRVILVPGPEDEVNAVQWIFRTFVEDQKSEREIALQLNEAGILTDLGRPWTRSTVHQLLCNEKYIGNNVWNRQSFKLKKKRVKNNPDAWLRAEGAFQNVVDLQQFRLAQEIIERRAVGLSDELLLDKLRQLFEQRGYLSGVVIDESEIGPSSSTYRTRFGGLLRAYELVGFNPARDYEYLEINRRLRALHSTVVETVVDGVRTIGGSICAVEPAGHFRVNEEFSLSIVLARCQETAAGSLRWQLHLDTSTCPNLTVAVRMDRTNSKPKDYYVLPWSVLSQPKVRLAESNGIMIDGYRLSTLSNFFELAARTRISEVA